MASANLNYASRIGDVKQVKQLLQLSGINVNYQNFLGSSPLLQAVGYGHLEAVKLLLQHPKIDVNHQNHCRDTALVLASICKRVEIVKLLLLQPGIDVNRQGESGNTPLICACIYNDEIEVVKLLLECERIGCDVQNCVGFTALMMAINCGRPKIAKYLIACPRVDVNYRNKDGATALEIASRWDYRLVLIKPLIRAGAIITDRHLKVAPLWGRKEVICQLKEWTDDQKMLNKLTLQQRCWLSILIHQLDYQNTIPSIISYILNKLWLGEDDGVWFSGYIIRMRTKVLSE